MDAVIGHSHGFGEALGLIVHPARADRVDVAPVVFFLGMDQRVPVHFRGRGEEKTRPFFLGESQRLVRPERPNFQGRDRHFEIVDGAGGRREVQDRVNRAFDINIGCDVLRNKGKAWVGKEVSDIVGVPGNKVIHADHLIAFVEEAFA